MYGVGRSGRCHMSEDPIIIDGLPIPFHDPALLVVLAIHILAAFTGVIIGIIVMVSQKRVRQTPTVRHDVLLVFVCSVRHSADPGCNPVVGRLLPGNSRYARIYSSITRASCFSFASAFPGSSAYQRHGPVIHPDAVAFYMDNGRHLPLWRDFPAVTYWMAPSAIGTALIVYDLLRYPRSQ
jgi:hypothetical protein